MASQQARLRALVNPASVAIIGASANEARLTSRPQRFLRRHGYAGRIFPVNPGRDQVFGETAFASIAAIGEPVEHATILLDTEPAIAALEECAAAGVQVVSMLANGFAESGAAGLARQQRVAAIARAAGMLLIGPNSTGVVDTRHGFSCTSNAAFALDHLPSGRIAAISQSGSLIGTMMSRAAARGMGFSTLISVGNEATAGVGEIGSILLADPDIDAFLLFIETIRNPQAVAQFARQAHALGKPVLAYRVGRSDVGQALSVSHTGALTGSGAAIDAFLRHHGVRLIEQFESIIEAPAALLVAGKSSALRPRHVTVLTTTGGGGAMLVDQLGARGVPLGDCPPATRKLLAELSLPAADGPLVDVTMAGTRYDAMKAIVTSLITDPAIGQLVVVPGSSAQFSPELAVRPVIDACAQAPAGAAPVLAFPLPQADESLRLFAQAGVPAFRTPEACAEALALMLDPCEPIDYSGPSALPASLTSALSMLPDGPVDEGRAAELFDVLGIVGPAQQILPAEPAQGAPTPAISLAYPVVAKLISADLPHKTELGAVALNLADGAALAAAIRQMRASVADKAPQARIDGVLVQVMRRGVAELIVGLIRDPVLGPVITVGFGGVLAELVRDTVSAPAPIDAAQARRMIDALRVAPLLHGFRGQPAADIDAAAQCVAAFSMLGFAPRVHEAEINPLLVDVAGAGVLRLDALLRLGPA